MNQSKQYTWHKIAESFAEFPWQPNNMCIAEAGGKKITLAKYKDEVFAFTYKCPHASGILAEGFIDATGSVVCPLHRYSYNIKNGINTSGEGYRMKMYKIEQRKDGIYAGWEEGRFWL